MEPATSNLMQRLENIGLNPQKDLNDCRPIVRRLARDLPTFDSVWIDALVQRRRLTPFQARQLESGNGQALRIGPVVVQQPLEPGEHCRTFITNHLKNNDAAVVKILSHHELAHQVFEQLEQLSTKLRSVRNPSIIGPQTCLKEQDRILAVSPNAQGRTVQELMVRRGRFSPRIVAEFGRQLIEGLAALESKSLFHGDITTVNLRLTDGGQATLVDTGIRSIVEPNVDLHSELPLRKLEGLAPERIGTNQPAAAKSDLYALGCLFWRLLSGRPVFLTADPLSLIAAHRSKDIVDVREWSPDTPAWMADLIRSMTNKDPDQRPASFASLSKRWGKPRRSGKRQLKKFKAGFNSAYIQRSTKAKLIPVAAVGLIVSTVFAISQSDRLPRLLNLSGSTANVVSGDSGESASEPGTPNGAGQTASVNVTAAATNQRQSIPLPDPTGRIQLAAGTYQASDITFAGHLRIESTVSDTTIVIHNGPMKLTAAEVSVSGIRFVDRRNSEERLPMLGINSQAASFQSASFSTAEHTSSNRRSAIHWQADDALDRSSGQIKVRDCIFDGSQAGLEFATCPGILVTENTLKTGAGPLIRFSKPPEAGRESQLAIRNTTLRNSGALLQLFSKAEKSGGLISLRHANCVFAIASNRAFIETYASNLTANQPLIEIQQEPSAESSLLATGVRDAAWLNTATRSNVPMPNGVVRMSGLSATTIGFAGPDSSPADCVVTEFEAPRRSALTPGIDVSRFANR